MKKFLLLCAMLFAFAQVWAQERTISGQVVSEEGESLPGVNVVLKGTNKGTVTDFDGNYKLSVPSDGGTLVFSFIGLKTQEVEIGERSVVDVTMASDVTQLSEVVVTALGVDREKASLGYATQEVSGEEVSQVKDMNFMNSLSGKVAGVNIKRSNQMGGSTNVVIRGYKSLTQNNQALFVVDGVILSNDISNTLNQQTGRGGYDYGNAAMDINPDDIKSINVLKGAAATALYGARAANGAIIITTKKGGSRDGVGVSASFGSTFGTINPETFIKYQKEYGPGYFGNDGLDTYDFGLGAGPQLSSAVYDDASYGDKFDPNLMVYNWSSYYPELETYAQQFPYVAGANDASAFYETSVMTNANISVAGGSDVASYRLSYTNVDQDGVLPNSNITRNTVNFSGGYDLTDKVKVTSNVTYTLTDAIGRYGTGYDNRNVNQSFRQWYNVGTDILQQKEAYEQTGLNLSWNPFGPYDPSQATRPHYFDNYYFNRFENFNTDERSRVYGNMKLDYELAEWLTFTGRVSTDRYAELREERIAVGSVDVSEYYRQNRNFYENNFDLFLNFNKEFGEDISLTGLLGTNFMRQSLNTISAETNGGLVTPGVYSLSNSINNPEAPLEQSRKAGTNGYFGQVSVGYDNFLYFDGSLRYDVVSTLPAESNAYPYYSGSMSLVFSELIESNVISLGKFRANYAKVGNYADPLLVKDIFILGTPFGGTPLASVSNIRRNPELRNEETNSIELGLEMNFLENRVGFEVSVYDNDSYDQIFQSDVSGAAGRLVDVVNAGIINNRGIEVSLRGTPVRTGDLTWNVNVNWAHNRNEVIELQEGVDNLQIFAAQGGITVNATVGEPFGTIKGTNYVYDDAGNPIVYPHPFGGVRFRKSPTPEVIGDINPDWTGGIQNILNYKGVTLSFLIDAQKGGNFFSLDTWYGYATGLYDFTAGINSQGVERRALPSEGGGIYDLDELGYFDMTPVAQATDAGGNLLFDEDGLPVGGEVNTDPFYVTDVYSSFGYVLAPNAFHVYDASFVKLREVSLGFNLPTSIVDGTPFESVNLALVGRNLWIIHKNAPYTDPEAGLSAGNNLGNQSGAYPAVREYGFNLSVKF